jgi:hypothetical protein
MLFFLLQILSSTRVELEGPFLFSFLIFEVKEVGRYLGPRATATMDEDSENIVDSGSTTPPRATVEADDGATAKCSVCKKRLGRKSKSLLLSGNKYY